MSYRYVYPNGAPAVGATPVAGYAVDPTLMSAGYPNGVTTNVYNGRRGSYSPGSFSSDSESGDDYEYRGRMITRDTRCPRDIVRAPTPPPIIKRVVERAPTPEAPIMERVIIRPQPQEIVERVIEQPRTPPPRIVQKEMHEEAPPPIVRTRVIKVDRPLRSGYSQPGSPYGQQCNALPSFSNGRLGGSNAYRTHSVVGSVGQPVAYHTAMDNNPSFSSASSFEYVPPAPMPTGVPAAPPQQMMMMMPQTQPAQPMTFMQPQQAVQPMGVMQQQTPVQNMGFMHQPMQAQQQQQQQIMYRPVQIQPSMPQMAPPPVAPFSSNYFPQNFMYPTHQGMSFGYRPMMPQVQQAPRMIPSGMPMMSAAPQLSAPATNFANQPGMFNPLAQQLVY